VSHPSTSTVPPVPHEYQNAPTANTEKTAEERTRNPRRINRRISDTVNGDLNVRLTNRKGIMILFIQYLSL
jgi:hypothetical protein